MPDVKFAIDAQDKASAKIKGVTGSIIKAQLIMQGLQMAVKAVIDVTGKSVEAFKRQEQAEAKLAAVTGTNIKQFTDFASAIQKVTTIGDEAVLGTQQLISSMGISNDKINEVTKGAIGLSKAFGADLSTSAKLAASAAQGNYEALTRYIPALKNATDESEKAAIVQKAMADGFKIAEAEASTFTGKLQQFKNLQGDVLESVGKVVSVVGVSFVDSMKSGAQGMIDFISKAENIGNIVGTIDTAISIIKDLGNTIKTEFVSAFEDLGESFKSLTGETDNAKGALDLFAGTIEGLKIGISVIIQLVAAAVQTFVDLVTAIKESAQVVGDFFQVLSGKKSWDDLKASADKAGEAFKNLGTNLLENITGIVTSTVEAFKELPKNAEQTANELEKTFAGGYKKGVDAFTQAEQQKTEVLKQESNKRESINTEEMNKAIGGFNNYLSSIGSAAQSAFGNISGYFMQMMEQQNASAGEAFESRLTEIDTQTQAQLEAWGLQDLTKTQLIEKELTDLQSQLSRAGTIEEQKRLQDQIKTKDAELKKTKFIEDQEKKKDEEKKKFAKEEFRRKIAAFNTQKALDMVTAGTQMALGIVSAAASGAQFGPASIAMIPILVALASAAGIASLAMIGSKQPPSMPAFAEGVTGFGGGAALVGEKGPELVTMGRGSNVVTNENLERMMGNSGSININNMTVMANDPREFADKMIDLRRYELAR
jgi:hypothetical protein